ncbi:response regulator [Emticicia sp. C21]|uniref:response regulator n=1 Tax=Emticicia sp. C21 TaxID=2302915 RepID=UPI000E354C6F|nr:response regulator [Emticicia sp. C21]RFS13324.1 DNA-binding response regulator [Emticicia sp. C21]
MKSKKVKIILLEDDEDDQLLFSMALDIILIPTDLTIIKDVRDLKNNLILIQRLMPDIIFIDLGLGLINGLEYLQKIRSNELLKQIPCIIMTDSIHPMHIEKAYDAGANLYIIKPVEFSVLVDIIRNTYILNWNEYFPPGRDVFYIHYKAS